MAQVTATASLSHHRSLRLRSLTPPFNIIRVRENQPSREHHPLPLRSLVSLACVSASLCSHRQRSLPAHARKGSLLCDTPQMAPSSAKPYSLHIISASQPGIQSYSRVGPSKGKTSSTGALITILSENSFFLGS